MHALFRCFFFLNLELALRGRQPEILKDLSSHLYIVLRVGYLWAIINALLYLKQLFQRSPKSRNQNFSGEGNN
jgi:hypothetical protein